MVTGLGGTDLAAKKQLQHSCSKRKKNQSHIQGKINRTKSQPKPHVKCVAIFATDII